MHDRSNRDTKTEAAVSLLVFLTFLICFRTLTDDPAHYSPCSELSDTYNWSVITFYVMIISFIFQVVIVPLISIGIALGFRWLSIVALLVEFSTFVMNLVCFIELWEAYTKEDCGNLSGLVLFYVVLGCVAMGVFLFFLLMMAIMLCLACIFGQKTQHQMPN